MKNQEKIAERFLRYASVPTMSDEESGKNPSTDKQFVLARMLVDELHAVGVADAFVDAKCNVYGHVPASAGCENAAALGLIAHMDTSPDAPDGPLKARIVEYEGGDILLNPEENIVMSPADYPCMDLYHGQHMIVTDGKTLLGADDKAGITAIISAVEKIVAEDLPHGKICIAFTPDEEIGCGTDTLDLSVIGADYAYTVDGGRVGELEYECFNAASARVTVNGVSIHPGSAKGKMKNAAAIAAELVSLMPAGEDPYHTDGYEGFYHLTGMSGDVEHARVDYIIRDHDKEKFEKRKQTFAATVDFLNSRYGEGTVECVIRDSYRNMKEVIEKHMYTVERAKEAMLSVGVTPTVVAIRGGTDGARLSFDGLPCPNLCTGGENFHSRFEFITVEALEKVTEIVTRIVTDASAFEK